MLAQRRGMPIETGRAASITALSSRPPRSPPLSEPRNAEHPDQLAIRRK